MEYKKSEIRAGIFLLISFVVFVVMIFAVSDVGSLFKKRKDVKAYFSLSDGIEKNAQVRLAGIKIGKVTGIRVAPERKDHVELTLSIYADAPVKEDSQASIKTLGLVGGKYVELTTGSPDAALIKPGGIIEGEESFKMEDLTKAGLEVVEKLRHIAASMDRLIGDPSLARNIKGAVQNVQDVTANVKDLTASLNENKASLTDSLKRLPDITKKLDETLANLKALSEKTDATLADNRKQIDAAMANVKDISQNVKELTDDVKKHPWKLIRKP